MKHLILRYDFPGSDQNHPVNFFPVFRRNIIFDYRSGHNRYSGMFPIMKKPTANLFLLVFFDVATKKQIIDT